MPTTKVELAWAMKVKICKLGAHLEAYHKLKPTFSTLRLCNRFGHGPQATVTKLPVELIQHIEAFLMKGEQAKALPNWKRDLKCWGGDCEPIDHLKDADILEHYNETHSEMSDYSEDGCDCGCDRRDFYEPRTKVTDSVRDWVIEYLNMCYSDGDDGVWRPVHDSRVESWCSRVGKPATSTRGRFDVLAKVLETDFGLTAWISHVQKSNVPDFTGENVGKSTKAYLRLPVGASSGHEWEPAYTDYGWSPQRQATESGHASKFVVPSTPTPTSLARFDRALKILGLKAATVKIKVTDPTPSADGADPISADTDQPEITAKPELTMLIRNCDKEQW